jgi:hypothetical protein
MWIFPSCDVHLVTESLHFMPPAPTTADIRVVLQSPRGRTGTWSDASTIDLMRVRLVQVTPTVAAAAVVHPTTDIPGIVHEPDPLDPIAIPPGRAITITRSAVIGTSFHLVMSARLMAAGTENVDGTTIQSGMIRVTTHDDIVELLAGDRSLSAFAGESNRVITVHGRFSEAPDVIEDVTASAWLKYEVTPAHVATVDREGRIKALVAGQAQIAVTSWDGRFRFEVPLTVRPALATPFGTAVKSDDLVRRTGRAATTVYVLAEGYTDEKRFFEHARKVVKSWREFSPYSRLKTHFHAIGVYAPSPDRGITIASRFVPPRNGSPATNRGVWEGGLPVPNAVSLTRDTTFGLMFGSRLSTSVATRQSTPGTAAVRFSQPDVARVIQPDERRLDRFGFDSQRSFDPAPPDITFAIFIKKYLQAAGHTVTPNDRVAFLVDDDIYGGLHVNVLDVPLELFPMVALSVGDDSEARNVAAAGRLFDRTIRGASLNADQVGSIFAHELAHSYGLGDEYERGHRSRTYTNQPAHVLEELERYENIQHDLSLRIPEPVPPPNPRLGPLRGDPTANLAASRLDVTRIKWNIHRVKKLSASTAIAAVATGHRLTVAAGQAARWAPGERAFLRNSLRVPKNVRQEPRTLAIAVEIVATNPAGNTVDVRAAAGTDLAPLGAAPLLYLPVTNDKGAQLGLIDPAVLAHLATHGPFPKGSPCDGPPGLEEYDNDRDCPPIEDFSRPSVNADAIGLYEGALDFSCDIYRPAGRCKMRKFDSREIEDTTGRVVKYKPVVVSFCFVCKYILVDKLDPAQHEGLDSEYPRDC